MRLGEIRNSKSEIRNKHEKGNAGNPKQDRQHPRWVQGRLPFSVFAHFGFVSDFGFRVSNLVWRVALAVVLGGGCTVALAKEGAIQCANLVYGGMNTSRCFSDEFLSAVQRETAIATERRFKSVKLDSDELFSYPFVLITGESEFFFSKIEREKLKRYLESGGFLLASAGCSSKEWDRSFRREVETIFGKKALTRIEQTHPIFRTAREIESIRLSHPGEPAALEGMEMNGKLVLIYSPHGLNDTPHTEGCCCCGGNEISNSLELNMNIFVYALLH
jgi:hypothetical protein